MEKQYSDFFIAAITADGYFGTAKLIRSSIHDGIECMLKYASPYIVNLAFSCELYMKALLLYRGIRFCTANGKGHDLRELYNQLCEEDKALICTKLKDPISAVDLLQVQRNLFVNFRYPYEMKIPAPLELAPFEEITQTLSEICTIRYTQHSTKKEGDRNAH